MQGSSRPPSRIANYHSTKRHLLGNQAGQVPPAWREQKPKEQGSKILLSRLPPDVGELEVEDLFRKTVGPLKEVFLIYNSQGRSKGMAIVSFQRPGDATVARAKYDGKFIDGRRPIKIEVIVDSTHQAVSPPPAQSKPSLLGRIGGTAPTNLPPSVSSHDHAPNETHAPNGGTHVPLGPRKQRPVFTAPLAVAPRRRQKKGPRRAKKTAAQLDQDMEEYRAQVTTSYALSVK